MRRTTIRLEDVAERANLVRAFRRAAAGKRLQSDVLEFEERFDDRIDQLGRQIRSNSVQVGRSFSFTIRDPKVRWIHAPIFEERVLHHALMAHVEPVIERYLVDDTFACRPEKGGLAAALRAQNHSRRFAWVLKLDIASYFASIDHSVLRATIRRRIKGAGVLRLIDRIIAGYEHEPGRGLPIGALTSQHFANLYLAPLDRYLLEELRVGAMCRYMDDVMVWHRHREQAHETLRVVEAFVGEALSLQVKSNWQIQRSRRGVTFCGFRVYPEVLRLSARRRRRYRAARRKWENLYVNGEIDAAALQAGYASALAITAGAEARAFRRRDLEQRPPVEA